MSRLHVRAEHNPPAMQNRLQVNPTLIVSWFCTIFSLVVILIRVFGRWIRTERLFREDKVMLSSIIPLLIRMACVHPVLLWGTNNTTIVGLTDRNIYHRSMGSRLVLASRIFYALYIWMAKVTVLEFVQKIIATSWTRLYKRGARAIYTFLGLSFVAVVISTLVECRPFSHYWQVVPDPGPSCRTGRTQLITMATCDIITDVVLIIFPIPLVIMSRMPMTKKVSMVFLFLLSLFLIGITAYRIPSTASRDYSQQFRSLLASIEILAATCVANVIVIGSFLRDKGVRKVKYRGGSIGESDGGGTEDNMLTRPATRQIKPSIAQRHWGSDEDLVRDFGVGLSADLRHELVMNGTARLAPVAEPANTPHHAISTPEPTINPHGRGLLDPAWTFRKGSTPHNHQRRDSDASSDSDISTDFKMRKLEPYKDEPSSPADLPETPYRKMSFFDVGGLVDVTSSERASAGQHTRRLSRSGQNFIADIGGLLGSPTTAQRPDDSSTSSGYRSSNLLLPEHAVRERPRSPGHGMSLVQALQDTRIDDSSHLVLHEVGDPDSLTFSDAGRLLR